MVGKAAVQVHHRQLAAGIARPGVLVGVGGRAVRRAPPRNHGAVLARRCVLSYRLLLFLRRLAAGRDRRAQRQVEQKYIVHRRAALQRMGGAFVGVLGDQPRQQGARAGRRLRRQRDLAIHQCDGAGGVVGQRQVDRLAGRGHGRGQRRLIAMPGQLFARLLAAAQQHQRHQQGSRRSGTRRERAGSGESWCPPCWRRVVLWPGGGARRRGLASAVLLVLVRRTLPTGRNAGRSMGLGRRPPDRSPPGSLRRSSRPRPRPVPPDRWPRPPAPVALNWGPSGPHGCATPAAPRSAWRRRAAGSPHPSPASRRCLRPAAGPARSPQPGTPDCPVAAPAPARRPPEDSPSPAPRSGRSARRRLWLTEAACAISHGTGTNADRGVSGRFALESSSGGCNAEV